MRALRGFCIVLLSAVGAFAQFRGSATPFISGGFGSVLYPGGTPATSSNITRFRAGVAFPGGGGPRLVVPNVSGFRGSGWGNGWGSGRSSWSNGGVVYAYPYPVYVGNYADPSGGGYGDPSMAGPPPQAGGPATAAPIIINIGVPSGAAPPPPGAVPPEALQQPGPSQDDTSASEPAHYLIALKDHTIYAAVAYWVDGTTLHYFTSGNVHNQVSLSLVDRDLTERLNKETGLQVTLPK